MYRSIFQYSYFSKGCEYCHSDGVFRCSVLTDDIVPLQAADVPEASLWSSTKEVSFSFRPTTGNINVQCNQLYVNISSKTTWGHMTDRLVYFRSLGHDLYSWTIVERKYDVNPTVKTADSTGRKRHEAGQSSYLVPDVTLCNPFIMTADLWHGAMKQMMTMMPLFLQRCHPRLCRRPCSQRLREVRRSHSNVLFVREKPAASQSELIQMRQNELLVWKPTAKCLK